MHSASRVPVRSAAREGRGVRVHVGRRAGRQTRGVVLAVRGFISVRRLNRRAAMRIPDAGMNMDALNLPAPRQQPAPTTRKTVRISVRRTCRARRRSHARSVVALVPARIPDRCRRHEPRAVAVHLAECAEGDRRGAARGRGCEGRASGRPQHARTRFRRCRTALDECLQAKNSSTTRQADRHARTRLPMRTSSYCPSVASKVARQMLSPARGYARRTISSISLPARARLALALAGMSMVRTFRR